MADEAFVPASGEWYYPSDEIVKSAHISDYDAVYQKAVAANSTFIDSMASALKKK